MSKEYYESCAFPKPKTKKKKLLENGYKNKQDRICEITGMPGAERHEIFGGSNRQLSIEYGLQVDLSPEQHRRIHEPKTDADLAFRESLKMRGQKKFEKERIEEGMSYEMAREFFIQLFGRNYL